MLSGNPKATSYLGMRSVKKRALTIGGIKAKWILYEVRPRVLAPEQGAGAGERGAEPAQPLPQGSSELPAQLPGKSAGSGVGVGVAQAQVQALPLKGSGATRRRELVRSSTSPSRSAAHVAGGDVAKKPGWESGLLESLDALQEEEGEGR